MAKKTKAIEHRAQSALMLSSPASSALALYDELFDSELTAGAAGETGIAPFISTTDGVMKHGEIEIGTELDAVILGIAVEHALYPQAYSKGKPSNPVCFYVGAKEEDAAPDPKSPQKQGATCEKCLKGAFGSASNGVAKACRQTRRLLILPVSHPLDPEAQLYRLRIPPTSVKHLRKYVKKVETFKRKVQGLVTHIEFSGHDKNRFEVGFEAREYIEDVGVLRALSRRISEAKSALYQLPMVTADGDVAAPVKGGRRIVKR
jgi:hypothetical protein